MIVASAAAVLLAVVLLVVGLVQPALSLVYWSIAVSVLAFGLLALVVRRHRHLPGDDGRYDLPPGRPGPLDLDRGGPGHDPNPGAPPHAAWQRPPP